MAAEKLSEVYGGPLELEKSSIFEYLEPNLRNNSHAAASIVQHQASNHLQGLLTNSTENVPARAFPADTRNASNCLIWTFQQLHQASFRIAQALLASGVRPGQSTLITFLPNGIEYHLFLWTCLLLKVTISNLDPGAVEPARRVELEFFLRALQPDVVIVASAEGASAVDEAVERLALPMLAAKIVAPPTSEGIDKLPSQWINLVDFAIAKSDITSKSDAELIRDAMDDDPERIFLILFTSGTSTGQPKGCLRTVRSHIHCLEAFINMESTRNLIFNANFRVTLPAHTLQTWKVGGAIIMPNFTFEPETVLEAIERFKVEQTTLVPYHLHALADQLKLASYDISSLRNVWLGGDMFSKELVEKSEKTFVHAKIFALAYGMTEGGAYAEHIWKRGTDEGPYIQGVRSVGPTMPGCRVRVVDIDSGKLVPRNTVGELHVCNASVVKEYLGGIRADSFYIDQYGSWLKTGDTGLIDDNGYIYLLGRSKDIIKRAGVPISPTAIEDCIDRHTGFKSVAFGLPHPTLGQQVFAVVAHYGDTNKDGLKQHILNEFGKDYALAGAASLQQLGLEDFPRNASGKIMKMELVPLAADYLNRQV